MYSLSLAYVFSDPHILLEKFWKKPMQITFEKVTNRFKRFNFICLERIYNIDSAFLCFEINLRKNNFSPILTHFKSCEKLQSFFFISHYFKPSMSRPPTSIYGSFKENRISFCAISLNKRILNISPSFETKDEPMTFIKSFVNWQFNNTRMPVQPNNTYLSNKYNIILDGAAGIWTLDHQRPGLVSLTILSVESFETLDDGPFIFKSRYVVLILSSYITKLYFDTVLKMFENSSVDTATSVSVLN